MARRSFDVVVVGGGPGGTASAVRCSQHGYKVLLVEKQFPHRHKPCGGVLPPLCTEVLGELGLKLPSEVMSTPPTLSLLYIPSSGRGNGGTVKGYRLLNINRDFLDGWLQKAAENLGVNVMWGADFKDFHITGEEVEVLISVNGRNVKFSTSYLIGADGALSRVREKLYPHLGVDTLTALQEWWNAEGDFGDCFYAFFKQEISPLYAYVIPKDGFLVLGVASPTKSSVQASDCMEKFRKLLSREFAFKPVSLRRREVAPIPYGMPVNGEGEVVLVGDAAGFCNRFSGEGVRLAIESGVTAAESVDAAKHGEGKLSSIYSQRIDDLNRFIEKTHEAASSLTDEAAEKFVKSELKRTLPV